MGQIDDDKIQVFASPLPFSNRRTKHSFPAGTNAQEMVDEICPYPDAPVAAIVLIDGDIIPKELWQTTTPNPCQIVNVRIVPQKGGGKNPLATILSIAVMIAAPYVAAAILGPGIIASTAAGAAFITRAVTAAVGVVGKLLVSALAPPPKPSTAGNRNRSNATESPTMFIEGASNAIDRYGVIPLCLGTNRMFPKQAALPFTETQNNDQYVRQMMTYGYGEKMTITEKQIGDTVMANFTNVEMVDKLDGDLHTPNGLYTNDVFQQEYAVLLEQADAPTIRTTQPGVDEGIIDITFVQGLFAVNSKGKVVTRSVQIKVEQSPTGAGTWSMSGCEQISVTAGQKETLRISSRINFPSTGTYDYRLTRLTADTADDKTFTQATFTAFKNITHRAPVNMEGLCGTVIRIKATEQLNGALDQFNALVSNHVLDYDDGASPAWILRATSNPASLYRYILQGPANARPLADDRIDIAALEDWHIHCAAQGYTYNRVIDYEASVDEILRDIAAAGAASPAIVDGKRTVVIDRIKDDIVQMVTPRNSWGYSGEILYPTLPHAFRVRFRNAEKGYLMDERTVYDDGYDESNATLFEVLELPACTSSALAFKTARRHIADARLRPENHRFTMAAENIVFLRGDRIKFAHDVPIIGVGDGRIKEVETDGDSPEMVTGIFIDDTVTIPNASNYFVRIRCADDVFLYKQVVTTVGSFNAFDFTEPFPVEDAPAVGDLCYFVEAGGEKDLIITMIEPADDLTAAITAQDYAPEIFTAESAAIPAFDSQITLPLELQRPVPPVLLDEQSDENAMLRNSDGTWLPRAIFTLRNDNPGDVVTSVQVRISGSTVFTNANVLEASAERVILTGLQDDTLYDVHIRYARPGATKKSEPLQLNNYLFIGASGDPHNVSGFVISVTGETALFKWDANTDIDFSHYIMKYSSVFFGAEWNTAQVLELEIFENRLALPFLPGTYLIKAVDYQGNESDDATAVITFNPGFSSANYYTINETDDSPYWPGTMDNVQVTDDGLVLIDETLPGYYYFADHIDNQGLFAASVFAEIIANGVQLDELALNDIFDMDDIFGVEDIFGLTAGSWRVTLEYRYTQDDIAGSPVIYNDWATFIAGTTEFWDMEFRLLLESFEVNISPYVQQAIIKAKMPERIERGEDLNVDDALGATIVFDPPFKQTPAIAITTQNGASDDRIEYISKDAGGFTFKVYNATLAGYVDRSFDYIASGFGRDNT